MMVAPNRLNLWLNEVCSSFFDPVYFSLGKHWLKEYVSWEHGRNGRVLEIVHTLKQINKFILKY